MGQEGGRGGEGCGHSTRELTFLVESLEIISKGMSVPGGE